MELEEIDRIHDEEENIIELLEKLMEEFTAKFADLGVSLVEFVNGYLRKRMEEVLYRKEQIPSDELEAQRELSVWLREERSVDDDFFELFWKEVEKLNKGF